MCASKIQGGPHLADGAQHAHALEVGLRAVAVGRDRALELRRRAADRRFRLQYSAGILVSMSALAHRASGVQLTAASTAVQRRHSVDDQG